MLWIVAVLALAVLGGVALRIARSSGRSEGGFAMQGQTAANSDIPVVLEASPPEEHRSSVDLVANPEAQERTRASGSATTTASGERRLSRIEVIFEYQDRDRTLLGALAARGIDRSGLGARTESGGASATHSVEFADRGGGHVATAIRSYSGAFPVAVELLHGNTVLASVDTLLAGEPLVVQLAPLTHATTEVRFRAVRAGEPFPLARGSVTRRSNGTFTQLYPHAGAWFAQLEPDLYDYSVTAANGSTATGVVDAALESEVLAEFWPAISLQVELGPLENALLAMLSPKSPLALAERPHPVALSESGTASFENVQPGSYSLAVLRIEQQAEQLVLHSEAYEIHVPPSPDHQTHQVQRLAGPPPYSREILFPGLDEGLLRWRDERGLTLYHGPAPSRTTLRTHSWGRHRIEMAPIVSTQGAKGPDMTSVRTASVELLADPPVEPLAIDETTKRPSLGSDSK